MFTSRCETKTTRSQAGLWKYCNSLINFVHLNLLQTSIIMILTFLRPLGSRLFRHSTVCSPFYWPPHHLYLARPGLFSSYVDGQQHLFPYRLLVRGWHSRKLYLLLSYARVVTNTNCSFRSSATLSHELDE